MNNFNQDFLTRQASRQDLGTIVKQQGSVMKQIAESYVRMQSLSEVANEIGELDYRVVAENGVVRMVMSAISLIDEFGINANFAGFNETGVVTFYVDADNGKLVAASGGVTIDAGGIAIANGVANQYLVFEDSNGDPTMYIASGTDDALILANTTAGKDVRVEVKQTDGTTRFVSISEDAANANVLQFDLGIGGGAAKISMGTEVVIWAAKDGTETVFNDGSYDINYRVETATNTHGFYIDGGAEYASFFGDSTNGLLIIDNGTDKRLEIGKDHYFPTRASSNPNGFWNEANQDMDYTFEGVSGINLISDAGLNAIGIGGAAESGYKAKIHGKVNLASGNTYDINGVPHTHILSYSSLTGALTQDANTYTPTLTGVTNVASVTLDGDWGFMRLGSLVIGGGPLTVSPTASSGTTRVEISLPIASNFTSAFDAWGNGTAQGTNSSGNFAADIADDRLAFQFQSPTTSAMPWRVLFMYILK
jgi:hypothetical protein